MAARSDGAITGISLKRGNAFTFLDIIMPVGEYIADIPVVSSQSS